MNKAKTEIRLLLSSLNQFLKKIPEPLKVNRAKSSISELLKKYDVENQGTLEKLTQELKYKYNFYKLAYPNISNELDKKFEANNIKEEVEKTIEVKFDHNLYWNDMIDESENKDNKDKKENINKDDIKTEEKMKTGKYLKIFKKTFN